MPKSNRQASIGTRYAYGHDLGHGFGEHAKASSGFGELSAEMKGLDLRDGQEVVLLDYDADSSWPIIEWTDGVGTNRITTIDPEMFSENFQEV